MKHLTLILTLFFSTMFASPAYADWEKVGDDMIGTNFYVDFDRIRTNGGYVYYWDLRIIWNHLRRDTSPPKLLSR